MSFTFDIPGKLAAMWQSGDLTRHGALLMDSSGKIVGHLQETGMRGALNLGSHALHSMLSGGGLVSGLIGNVQNEVLRRQNNRISGQIDEVTQSLDAAHGKLDGMQSALGSLAGMQMANLAVSVASIGVSAAGFQMIARRLDALRSELQRGFADTNARIDTLQQELQLNELLAPLERAMTKVERVDSVRLRRDPRPVLLEADAALHECVNAIFLRIARVQQFDNVPIAALAELGNGLAITSSSHIKTLFLLNETAAAAAQAEIHADKLMALLQALPPDLLADRLRRQNADPATAQALADNLIETGHRIAAIPPLVATLAHHGISGTAYLTAAEAETTAPLLFLPAKA